MSQKALVGNRGGQETVKQSNKRKLKIFMEKKAETQLLNFQDSSKLIREAIVYSAGSQFDKSIQLLRDNIFRIDPDVRLNA